MRQRRFIYKYNNGNTRCKATAEIKSIVERQMREDDKTTASQLFQILRARGYNISLRAVLRCRTSLDFVITATQSYKRQLFRDDAIASVEFQRHRRRYDGDLPSFCSVPSKVTTFSV